MIRDNIIRANLWRGDQCRTAPVWQWDYGQILKIEGVDLPTAYEVHFTDSAKIPAIVQIGNADGVSVPDQLLDTGRTIIAHIYLHATDSSGETVKTITIPVNQRASISNETPTPEQQSAISEAIEALNEAVETVGEGVTAASESAAAAAESANAAEVSATSAANAKTAAETAKGKAEDAQSAAESAARDAGGSADSAALSATSADGSASAAANAKTAAQTAQGKAEAAQTAAESAASNASADAISAGQSKTAAQQSATNASASESAASSYATTASQKATAAGNAQTAAETAQGKAETAQGKAETAQTAAETAQGKAEDAQSAAEDAKDAVSEMVDGIAQEDTAQEVLTETQAIREDLEEILENNKSIRYYDELPDTGTEGWVYITPEGIFYYHLGEYSEIAGNDTMNGFSMSLGTGGAVVLSYTNPEDETDTDSATLPTNSGLTAILNTMKQITADLEIIAGGDD